MVTAFWQCPPRFAKLLYKWCLVFGVVNGGAFKMVGPKTMVDQGGLQMVLPKTMVAGGGLQQSLCPEVLLGWSTAWGFWGVARALNTRIISFVGARAFFGAFSVKNI